MTTSTGAPHGHNAAHAHYHTTVSCDACGRSLDLLEDADALSLYRNHEAYGVKVVGGVDPRACRHLCGHCVKCIYDRLCIPEVTIFPRSQRKRNAVAMETSKPFESVHRFACDICRNPVEDDVLSLYYSPDVDGVRPGPRVVTCLQSDADLHVCKQCAACIAVCVEFAPTEEEHD